MLPYVILALAGAFAGALLTYFFVSKKSIPLARYQEQENLLLALRTEEGVLRRLFEGATAARESLSQELERHRKALSEHGAELAILQTRHHHAELACKDAAAKAQELEALLDGLRTDCTDARQAAHTAQIQRQAALEKLEEQRVFIAEMKAQMERDFQSLAQQTLELTAARQNETHKNGLETTLRPFREQLDQFRKQVDERFSEELRDRNSLKGELHNVFALTNKLSEQTNRLTNALTTQTKTQGNLGEDILEMLLVNAGMVMGEHYHKQVQERNEKGERIIPDFVLQSPEGFSIVVDSKVSLNAYVRYCNDANTPEETKALRREIWQSFKNHIDGLAGKQYQTINGSARLVLMFTPFEDAFTVAAGHDTDIRQYAFDRRIFLVTPSSLLLVLRMISDLWQQDRVSREARDMAETARKLYEKAVGFLTSFHEVGAALDRAQEKYTEAQKRMQGRGGLYSQAEKLQDMLGKDAKKLPEPASPLT